MKKTTLVVMAAGIGSRFGGGIKQLEPHTHFRSWTIFRQASKDRREGPNPGEPVRRFSAAKIWFRSRLQ